MIKGKKRICLFAGFDQKGEIADYVVYYLKALAQIADVYYWGDFATTEPEQAKIKPYCKAIYCKKHGKYDFGSWQELIRKIGRTKIETYDELILANDSCYGPLTNLEELFAKMEQRDCDFWGLSLVYNWHIHLQSYFVVLNQPVIRSDVFYNFFEGVKPEADYNDVCANYEDKFTYTLSKAGFSFCSLIDYTDLKSHPYRDMMAAIKNRHFPFLKVKFFLGGIRDQAGADDWRQVIRENTDYPVELIEDDLRRRGYDLSKIDQNVQEKQSETPDFYSKGSLPRRVAKKLGIIVLKPFIYAVDRYLGNRTAQYFYKLDRVNREYRQLQQQYDTLRSQIDADFSPKKYQLAVSEDSCSLQLKDADASFMRRFDLELPLGEDADVLIIGNIGVHNLASLELYRPTTTFLNNSWTKELGVEGVVTDNLCDFRFVDSENHPVFFDFILVQPLQSAATDAELQKFVTNLKRQMLFESVLAMFVQDDGVSHYEEILQSVGLVPAISERGLVVRGDPFQVYYDKIGSIKGYKTLVYKIK